MPAAVHSELLTLQRDVGRPALFELILGGFVEAFGLEFDVCEGRVDLEHIGDVLRTLGSEKIDVETANERRTDVSVASC